MSGAAAAATPRPAVGPLARTTPPAHRPFSWTCASPTATRPRPKPWWRSAPEAPVVPQPAAASVAVAVPEPVTALTAAVLEPVAAAASMAATRWRPGTVRGPGLDPCSRLAEWRHMMALARSAPSQSAGGWLAWWLGELRELLPPRWRATGPRTADRCCLQLERPFVRVHERRGRRLESVGSLLLPDLELRRGARCRRGRRSSRGCARRSTGIAALPSSCSARRTR